MASFEIKQAVTTAQFLAPGESGRVYKSGSILTNFGPSVSMSGDARLLVQGAIDVLDGPTINGGGDGLTLDISPTGYVNSPYNYAVFFIDGRNFKIENEGTLSSGLSAIFFSAASSGQIVNSGLITGEVAIGAFYQFFETLTIVNTGLIQGNLVAISQEGGALHVTNYGTIRSLGAGPDAAAILGTHEDDVVVNFGRIDGRTEFRSGTNVFDGREGVQDAVIGGDGDDRIYGGDRRDELYGGAGGDDRLHGGRSKDALHAGDGGGSNRLYGQDGADTLHDGSGDDRLYGGSNQDILIGRSGPNVLSGGKGGDRLIAGLDRDLLIGGTEGDAFVFAKARAPGRGAQRDVIRDFDSGEDQIDLAGIGRSARFTFIGDDAFSGSAFELRYIAASGVLQGDTSGNGAATFAIELEDAPRLELSDLLL